jgi:uncharacterized protein
MNPNIGSGVTISSIKYNKIKQYEWSANILDKTNEYLVTIAPPGRQLFHHAKNKIFTFDSWAIEFFPFDEWYTASISVNSGHILDYYCNICMPPTLDGSDLSFIDLDLDYINFDGEWTIVDEDEFAINQIKYSYPDDLINRTSQELNNLIQRVKNKKFPFDGTFKEYLSFAV